MVHPTAGSSEQITSILNAKTLNKSADFRDVEAAGHIFNDQYIKVCNLPVMFAPTVLFKYAAELPGFEFGNEAEIYFLFSRT